MALEIKSCPDSMRPHVEKVFAGEYSAPIDFVNLKARVLDIGANVGAFTLWATQNWPGCLVSAFEPHPDNAKMWRENCAELVAADRAQLTEAAVSDRDGAAQLFDGVFNCGEASIVFNHATASREIKTISAASLPSCHVLKLDTEGCEPIILQAYPHTAKVPLILLEFHREEHRQQIEALLNPTHRLCELRSWMKHFGIMKWMSRAAAWK